MEINQTMLTPLMCEACILRRRKRTSRRKIACCFFIAFNAIVLSVFSVTLWYINDRLTRTEGAIAVLKEQSKTSEETLPIELLSRTTKPDVVEKLSPDNPTDNWTETLSMNVNRMLRRKRASSRRRGKKRCKASKKGGRQTRTASSSIPHFYLNGSRSSGRVTDVYGNFIWKRPEHRTFSRGNDFFDATINSDNSLTKVRILRSGVYFVFAKVTANGRSPLQSNVRPSVGIYLKKNDEVLDIAWTTQDNRGGIYNVLRGHYSSDEIKYPMDSLSVSGLHRLEANDEIYVQRPPDTVNSRVERFLVENNKAGFGAFLVEAECSSC